MRLALRLLLAGIFFSPASILAQESADYGVKLGVSASEVYNSYGVYPARWGPNGGLFVTLPMRPHLRALGSVDYHAKGNSVDGDNFRNSEGDTLSDLDYRYDYISLLSAAQYETDLSSLPFTGYAFFGPRIDALVNKRFTWVLNGARVGQDDESDASNRIILGASAGVGLDFSNILGAPVMLELRYNRDLTPAFSHRITSVRHQTLDLRFGYAF